MQRDFIITKQGRDYVLYAGLLDAAHRSGLREMRTTLIQAPGPQNGFLAICHVEVTTDRGTYTALGDADPENTTGVATASLIRVAELRAKARALADAVNVAMPVIEDTGEGIADPPLPTSAPSRAPASRIVIPTDTENAPAEMPTPRREARLVTEEPAQPRPTPPPRTPAPRTTRSRAEPTPVATGANPPTANQIDAITRLARATGRSVTTDGLTRVTASELITRLSTERYPVRRDDPETVG